MSICFYTITPEPPHFPVAYICRVFLNNSGSTDWIDTKSFPIRIRTPEGYRLAYAEADLYGQFAVSSSH